MQNANYTRHLKVLGKLTKAYDDASTIAAAEATTQAAALDQVADGTPASLPGTQILANYMARWTQAIQNGPGTLQSIMAAIVSDYLSGPDFRGDLTNTPASITPKAVLDAWILDMIADSKTFTTTGSTGLVHFLTTLCAPDGTIPQAGSPTYADATYVTDAQV